MTKVTIFQQQLYKVKMKRLIKDAESDYLAFKVGQALKGDNK